MGEDAFVISIPWLLEDESNYDKCIPKLLQFMEDKPKLQKYIQPKLFDNKEFGYLAEKVLNIIDADKNSMSDSMEKKIERLLVTNPEFKSIYDDYETMKNTILGKKPQELLKAQLEKFALIGKRWIDAYRGFTGDTFTSTMY